MDLRNQQIKETYGNLATINTTAGTPTTGVLQNGAGSNVTSLTIEGTLDATNVDATNLTGTLATAAQTNITSLGTLTGLAVSGDANFDSGTLFVDVSENRVGIGTTSPSEKLVVNGAIVWQGALTASQTNGGVLDRSGNDLRIRAYGATSGTGNLVFRTGGGGGSADSEAMRIDSSGNVGIGVTPSAWNTAGDTKALQISTVTAVGEAYDTAFISANWYLVSGPLEKYIGNGIASRMTLSSDPNGKNISLSTAPNNTSGAGASLTWKERFGMNLTEAVINDASEDYDFRVEGATDTHLIFADAGNDRVGIGTSSPSELLHVDGDVLAGERISQNRVDARGQYQSYVFNVGAVTSSGTFSLLFDSGQSGSVHSAAYIKLSILGSSGSGAFANSPSAEYAFELFRTDSPSAMQITSRTAIFEHSFTEATDFAFTDNADDTGTVTITNPSASSAFFTVRVEILSYFDKWSVSVV